MSYSGRHNWQRTAKKARALGLDKPSPTAFGMPRAEYDRLPPEEKLRLREDYEMRLWRGDFKKKQP